MTTTINAVAPLNADDPELFDHHFCEVNGIHMHYVEAGSGPLVILLHGFPFLWYLWRHQIRALAQAGYRVVAPDQRGYGQTSCPEGVEAYDITKLVGDVVGLMKSLDEESAVLVGQDWGSVVGYHCAAMRPDLFRGLFMMCTPPQPRLPASPSSIREHYYSELSFYQECLIAPETVAEISGDLRSFLSGIYYSTSGSCADTEQWRWAWRQDEQFRDTYTVPKVLPPHLSQTALDYYVSEFTRTGIQPSIHWYGAIDRTWEMTSFLDGVVAKLPAVFLTGERDPALKANCDIDRQGPAFASLKQTFSDLREIITIEGAGHTPPEEKPAEVNSELLRFLDSLPA